MIILFKTVYFENNPISVYIEEGTSKGIYFTLFDLNNLNLFKSNAPISNLVKNSDKKIIKRANIELSNGTFRVKKLIKFKPLTRDIIRNLDIGREKRIALTNFYLSLYNEAKDKLKEIIVGGIEDKQKDNEPYLDSYTKKYLNTQIINKKEYYNFFNACMIYKLDYDKAKSFQTQDFNIANYMIKIRVSDKGKKQGFIEVDAFYKLKIF